ncbi:short-chain dehydrogenase [Moniliophthora roreri MCA 2997]|uniref:Short-chain dehydrogenase n=2 Tax=Moniliophthora roreri TaxID=221103 RepID=V2Y9Z7_MONRO|nr:short-chain dehydrogenase [Moniliophthora roreri MCA 2997]
MMSSHNKNFTISSLFNVEDYVVIVTGGGTGIGLMISQAFANNGSRIYITSRRKETLEQATKTWGSNLAHPKGQIIPIQCDITDKQSIQAMVDEVKKKEKHVDVLVNNSGISEGTSSVELGSEDKGAQKLGDELWNEDQKAWEDVYRTNVIGHFFTTAALIPLLSASSSNRPNHTSSIINISSISGITRTTQHHYKYNVSKAASIHLNTILAQELRRKGVNIRVNSIAPGIFPSEMTTEGSDELNKSSIPVDDSYRNKKGIPAGRPGRDEDMAQAALMLAVNQYAYGQTIAIDGGYLLEHP